MLHVTVTAVSSEAIRVDFYFDTFDTLPNFIAVNEFDQSGNQINTSGNLPLPGSSLTVFGGLQPSTTYFYQVCSITDTGASGLNQDCTVWNAYSGTTQPAQSPPTPPSSNQKWWIHNLSAVTAGGPPVADGSLSAYVWAAQKTQHVVYNYVDSSNVFHPCELYYNGSWWFNNLTNIQGNSPSGYAWEQDNTEHIIYYSNNDVGREIWELYYSENAWHNHSLTASVGDAPLALGSQPLTYVWKSQNTQHVFYVGNDSHVHELYFDGSWHHNDLTNSVGDNPPAPTGGLTGFAFERENTQHVFYLGQDKNIHEFYYDGAWHHNNLSVDAGFEGFGNHISTNLSAYAWENDGTEHVFFGSMYGDIFELWYRIGGQWNVHNVTNMAGVPSSFKIGTAALAAYVWENQGTEHVIYLGNDDHIHELWFDQGGVWHHNDLNYFVGSSPAPKFGLCGYAWEDQNTQHIFFVGTDNSIYEIYYA